MEKRTILLLAVCAGLLFAAPVCAQTGTCADLEGTWAVTYTGDITDTVTINSICSKPDEFTTTPACMPGPGGPVANWLCVARGTRASDGKVVQFRQISMDLDNFAYYEATDAEIIAGGPKQPYDLIPQATFSKCAFNATWAKLGRLMSGQKNDCSEVTTTTTTTTTAPAGPCPAQKVLGEDNPELDNLRAFRDGALARSVVGRSLTRMYYNNAASINEALDRSPALQAIARNVFEAVVLLEGNTK